MLFPTERVKRNGAFLAHERGFPLSGIVSRGKRNFAAFNNRLLKCQHFPLKHVLELLSTDTIPGSLMGPKGQNLSSAASNPWGTRTDSHQHLHRPVQGQPSSPGYIKGNFTVKIALKKKKTDLTPIWRNCIASNLPLLNGASFLLALKETLCESRFSFKPSQITVMVLKVNVFQNRCLKPTFVQQSTQCYSPKILYSIGPPEAKGSQHTVKKAAKRINTQSGSLNLQPDFSLLILKELHKSWFKGMSTGKDLGEEGEKAGQFVGNFWGKKYPLWVLDILQLL